MDKNYSELYPELNLVSVSIFDFLDKGSFDVELSAIIDRLSSECCCRGSLGGRAIQIRKKFIEYLKHARHPSAAFDRFFELPRVTEPGDENISLGKPRWFGLDIRRMFAHRDEQIKDILLMLGKIAKKMNSPFLPRVVALMEDFNFAVEHEGVDENAATQLVDEFVSLLRLVTQETLLLDEDEQGNVWPRAPKHYEWDDGVDVKDEQGAKEVTKANREKALSDYNDRIPILMLGYGADLEELKSEMEAMAKDIEYIAEYISKENNDLTTRCKVIELDEALLSRILAVKMAISYMGYDKHDEDDDALDWDWVDEPMAESKLKEKIVRDLDRYLSVACKLAKTISPKAYEDFTRCQSLQDRYHGNYYADDDGENQSAAKDLKTFMDSFENARSVLRADSVNYIKPKEKAKSRHKGNGLKGTKTAMMAKQGRIFEEYLLKNPIIKGAQGKTKNARAKQCWGQHQEEWNKAAKASGEQKGYSSPKALAFAMAR